MAARALIATELVAEAAVRHGLAPTAANALGRALMGAVEVYRVLVEHCDATPPDRDEVEALRDETLRVFDDEKPDFTDDSNAEHIANRRRRIAATFARTMAR